MSTYRVVAHHRGMCRQVRSSAHATFASTLVAVGFLLGCGGTDAQDVLSTPSTSRTEYCDDWVATVSSVQGATTEEFDDRTAEMYPSATDAKDWADRIEVVERMVSNLPPEWSSHGVGYLELVRDRADLLAEYGYPSVQQLPTEVRERFIDEHIEDQRRAIELIGFLRTSC